MGIGIWVSLFFLSVSPSSAAENPTADPLLEELKGIQESEAKHKERLHALDDTLPELNPDQAMEYAAKLGARFKNAHAKIKESKTKTERAKWIASAELLLESAALLSAKIDAGDNAETRIRAYEKMVERRRLPVKVLSGVAGVINMLAGATRGGALSGLDIYDSAQHAILDPFRVSPQEWPQILAKEFLNTLKEKAGVALYDGNTLQLEPGLDGAMRVRRSLTHYLRTTGCESKLLP